MDRIVKTNLFLCVLAFQQSFEVRSISAWNVVSAFWEHVPGPPAMAKPFVAVWCSQLNLRASLCSVVGLLNHVGSIGAAQHRGEQQEQVALGNLAWDMTSLASSFSLVHSRSTTCLLVWCWISSSLQQCVYLTQQRQQRKEPPPGHCLHPAALAQWKHRDEGENVQFGAMCSPVN